MVSWIRKFLTLEKFEDEDEARTARLLITTLLVFSVAVVIAVVTLTSLYGFPKTLTEAYVHISGVLIIGLSVVLMVFVRQGRLRLVSAIFVSAFWLLLTYWIWLIGGLSGDLSSYAYPLVIILAGLLLGDRGSVVFTGLSILAVLGGYFVEAAGFITVAVTPVTVFDLVMMILILLMTGLLQRHAMRSISGALDKARKYANAQAITNRELENIRASLEERVIARTADLERRSRYVQAAADVGRAVSSTLEAGRLIQLATDLIHDRFGIYHVGLFLLDATRHWLEYRAGSGEAGALMAEQKLRLEVGDRSMMSWCVLNKQARLALDVRTDPVYVEHELLPNTRSEVALPLISRGEVIGALSVQSDALAAFDQDLIAVLQSMADQIASAIVNAHLFTESQEALAAERRAYAEVGREGWAQLVRARPDLRYLANVHGVQPVQEPQSPEMATASRMGQIVLDEKATACIPIRVREQLVGALRLRKSAADAVWTENEIALAEAVTERLGEALESARLYQDTQRSAAREQMTSEITSRMRASLNVDSVLRTAVDEIYQALRLEEIVVQLATDEADSEAV